MSNSKSQSAYALPDSAKTKMRDLIGMNEGNVHPGRRMVRRLFC